MNYLGEDQTSWQQYDASLLMANSTKMLPILVDQGDSDNFMENQLMPETLEQAAAANNYPLELRYQQGYDHSYYFIASFIEDHLRFITAHLPQ